MSTTKLIIGLDLAWKAKNPSYGVLVSDGLEVLESFSFTNLAEFGEKINQNSSSQTLIFIDAPLHCDVSLGIRECDRKFLNYGIPILPVNHQILKKYQPFLGFELKNFLISQSFEYCGTFDKNSFYEVYAFGNASLVFGVRTKRELLRKWNTLFSELGFTNLHKITSIHHLDGLCCTLPYFITKWRFDIFDLYDKKEYCMFIPR